MDRKYTVKEASELSKLSRRQLRYYEDMGLLQKVYRDSSNYRVYTKEQILILNYIKELRELGFGFDELFTLIHNIDVSSLRNSVKKGLADAKSELAKSVALYEKKTNTFIKILEATYMIENATHDCVTEKINEVFVEEKNIIAYEYEGVFNDEAMEFFRKYKNLDYEIEQHGLTRLSNKMCQFVNHFHGETGTFNFQPHKIKLFYEIAETKSESELHQRVASFKAASIISIGGYKDELIKAYEKIFAWAKENNKKLADVSYEDFLLDLSISLNSDYWVTRVYIPILETR